MYQVLKGSYVTGKKINVLSRSKPYFYLLDVSSLRKKYRLYFLSWSNAYLYFLAVSRLRAPPTLR